MIFECYTICRYYRPSGRILPCADPLLFSFTGKFTCLPSMDTCPFVLVSYLYNVKSRLLTNTFFIDQRHSTSIQANQREWNCSITVLYLGSSVQTISFYIRLTHRFNDHDLFLTGSWRRLAIWGRTGWTTACRLTRLRAGWLTWLRAGRLTWLGAGWLTVCRLTDSMCRITVRIVLRIVRHNAWLTRWYADWFAVNLANVLHLARHVVSYSQTFALNEIAVWHC